MAGPQVKLVETAAGRYLSFAADSVVSRSLEAQGSFERHLVQIAAEVHRRRGRPGLLVDAGAYIGTFSIPVALATGCAVEAFEPQRPVAQLLGANYLLNGILDARVHNAILSGPEHPPEQRVRWPDYAASGNFAAWSVDAELLREVSMKRMTLGAREEAVAVRALDELALDEVFLVKLDVEGHELEVLKGAAEMLERNRFPPLLFEAWREAEWAPRKRALLAFVEELGYDVHAMDENFFAQHLSAPPHLRLQL